MDEERVETDGALLAVRQSRQHGAPIVMLHGGPGVPDILQTTVGPLLPECRCITFDQRGVGRSECHDRRYDLAAYLNDIEAVRRHLGLDRWHVFGHSWGGLLGQAYTARYSEQVVSLVLSSSSLGVGRDWKRTKREAFRTDRDRAGFWGTLRFLAFGSGVFLPGPTRHWSMRHVMTETWHNYFLEPTTAPDPDPDWLAGCSAEAMLRTDRAVRRDDARILNAVSGYEAPVLVLYGDYDIFGSATHIVRDRFPAARQVTLHDSGHVHWIQNPEGYREVLQDFYRAPRRADQT